MEFLNYHHLRYFWVVAKEGGLRKGAEKLHVSQPTVSAQIAALESSVGEKLFRRGGRALSLTEAGQRVFHYAEEIFSLGQELMLSMKQQPTSRPLRCVIGVADSLPKIMSYEIIKPIFNLGQPVHAVCREGKAEDLLAQLAAFRLDIVLADEPSPSSLNIKAFNHRLGECGVCFWAAPAMAARLKRNFPASLNAAPALLPAANCALRRSLEAWFSSAGLRPRTVAEFDDMALMLVAAADGLGFMPMPEAVPQEAVKRSGVQLAGRAPQCRLEFYAISAERKLTHAAVLAITSQAQTKLFR
jgi:LysR family transcriptional regulator, transcriptional activator of nhaA